MKSITKSVLKIFSLGLLLAIFSSACETSEDIVAKMDTQVPDIYIDTDSVSVLEGEIASLRLRAEDPSGIKRIEASYGAWSVIEFVDFTQEASYPDSYEFSFDIEIPIPSEKSWVETGYYNNGSSYQFTQYYHKIAIKVVDSKLNTRNTYLFIRVL